MTFTGGLPTSMMGARRSTQQVRLRRILRALALLLCLAGLVWFLPAASSPSQQQQQPTRGPVVDVVFAIDATGSMGDEIDNVKANLLSIGSKLVNRRPQPEIRFGAVFYRDHGDEELVKVVPLSSDFVEVRERIKHVQAYGGGDWPEHMGIALHKALQMDWATASDAIKLIYVVADAPPHYDYDDGYDVESAIEDIVDRGIKVHVIGCSGLGSGEKALREISARTGGRFETLSYADEQAQTTRDHHLFHRPGSAHSSTAAPSHDHAYHAVHGPTSSLGPVIGIDFGSSWSRSAIFKNGRVNIIPDSSSGAWYTPSYVSFAGSDVLVGQEAALRSRLEPNSTVSGVKRLLGVRDHGNAVKQANIRSSAYEVLQDGSGGVLLSLYMDGGRKNVTAEEVASKILAKLRNDAEEYLGKVVNRAVLTVPASFNDAKRQALKDAGRLAGLNVLRILNEPSSAAIAYGLDEKSESNIIVINMGAEVLEVSYIMVDNGVFETVATSSKVDFGGSAFDKRLVDHLLHLFQQVHPTSMINARDYQMLEREAERVRQALSSKLEEVVDLDNFAGKGDFKAKLTRAKFEHLADDLFRDILIPIKQVLTDSGLKKNQVDEIILVGGASRMPKVYSLMHEFFGKVPNTGVNPDEAVVKGAALQAGILSGEGGQDLLLLDVTPLTIGLNASGGLMSPLIRRNTVIPTKKNVIMSTLEDNQSEIHIQVFEGERTLAKDNVLLTELRLSGIPPAPRGQPQIEVTLEIDSDGILNVGAEDKGTGKSEKITVVNDNGRLTEEQIERMIKDTDKFADADRALQSYILFLEELHDLVEGNDHTSISDTDREFILNATGAAKHWLMSNPDANASSIEERHQEVDDLCTPILAKLLNEDEDGVDIKEGSFSSEGGNKLAAKLYRMTADEL